MKGRLMNANHLWRFGRLLCGAAGAFAANVAAQVPAKDCTGGLRLFPSDVARVDPELRAMMPLLAGPTGGTTTGSTPTAADIAAARERLKGLAAMRPQVANRSDVIREERSIPGPKDAPPVRVLIYKPVSEGLRLPALLDIHGGAFILGSADSDDAFNRRIAGEMKAVVV